MNKEDNMYPLGSSGKPVNSLGEAKEISEGLDPILFTTPKHYVEDRLKKMKSIGQAIEEVCAPLENFTQNDYDNLNIDTMSAIKDEDEDICLAIKFKGDDDIRIVKGKERVVLAIQEMVRVKNTWD